jgi:porin
MLKGSTIFLTIFIFFIFSTSNVLGKDQKSKEQTSGAGGIRAAFLNKGININAIYTGEILSNLQGGISRASEYLGVVDLMISIDLYKLVNWKNAAFYTDILGIHGGNPSDHSGDFQGVSNIAASNNWKIFEAWLQQKIIEDKLSILTGIYDLNAEFDVIEISSLFINSSFGMGPELSQSGKNGVSTFPHAGLAFRIKAQPAEHLYIQSAVMDGVPGDPENPGSTSYTIKKEDGALFASEIAYITGEEKRKYLPPSSERKQRRRRPYGIGRHKRPFQRKGRNRQFKQTPGVEIPCKNYSKIAVGGWYYTSDFDDLFDCDEFGNPIRQKGNWGIYALGEKVLFSNEDNPAQALSAFMRVGIADKNINQIDTYLGAGMVYSGIFSKHYNDQIGFAAAAVHNSEKFREAKSAAGETQDKWEIALELSYRAQINKWFSMQPDFQYIINPGFDSSLKNALIMGARIEISL